MTDHAEDHAVSYLNKIFHGLTIIFHCRQQVSSDDHAILTIIFHEDHAEIVSCQLWSTAETIIFHCEQVTTAKTTLNSEDYQTVS